MYNLFITLSVWCRLRHENALYILLCVVRILTDNINKMDVFNKFIIETDEELGDCLILGRVTYHKQLAFDKEKVKSGGWWREKDGRITFFGESHDFGRATQEQVTEAVMNNKVFTSYILEHPINKDYKFSYDRQSEVVELT